MLFRSDAAVAHLHQFLISARELDLVLHQLAVYIYLTHVVDNHGDGQAGEGGEEGGEEGGGEREKKRKGMV